MNKFLDLIKETLKRKSIYRILMNWAIYENCQDLKGLMIDLGGGEKPSYYNYWKINPTSFIVVDIDEKKPDIVCDLNKPLPFEDNFADVIFLFNVIYIINKPENLVKEIHRVLKSDGKFFLCSPFIFNEAKEPHDYFRLTSEGISTILDEARFKNYQIIPFGERFTAALFLTEKLVILNILKIPIRLLALFLDKIYPKKLKKFHPCPIGYFIEAIK